jgi:hypothetical protein
MSSGKERRRTITTLLYAEGYAAYALGASRSSYRGSIIDAMHWTRGWDDAKRDATPPPLKLGDLLEQYVTLRLDMRLGGDHDGKLADEAQTVLYNINELTGQHPG